MADSAIADSPREPPLNPDQQAAVDHASGPLSVLAGAGTGKTRVLTHRVAKLVQRGIPPWAILCVTFTNKAAAEMRARLAALLPDGDASVIWVGTFHSMSARLLRRFGPHVGLPQGFAIYDESDQTKIVSRIAKEISLPREISPRQIVARISWAKDRGADPAAATGHPADASVAAIWPHYRDALRRDGALDFADLLGRTLDVLDVPACAELLARKFAHVLVDEFQDTNLVQYSLIRKLAAARNLTVVGDDDQAIYAWRGAEPANLLHFETDYPDARIVKLEQNYRSRPQILAAANAVVARNLLRHDKTLWTDTPRAGRPDRRVGGDAVIVHCADDDLAEASFVSREIAALLASGVPPTDIAVLYRTNAQSRLLEEALLRHGAACRVLGGSSFFDRQDVRDVLAYLRLVALPDDPADPTSDEVFARVLHVPPRGIGPATLAKLRVAAKQDGTSLRAAARAAGRGAYQAVLTPSIRKKLGEFAALVDEIADYLRGGASVAQTLEVIIKRSGLGEAIARDQPSEARSRAAALEDLVSSAQDHDDRRRAAAERARHAAADAAASSPTRGDARPDSEVDPWDADPWLGPSSADQIAAPGDREVSSVVAYLEDLALATTDGLDVEEGDDRPAVCLATIHVAKGLEWPVVFVVGLEEGLFPSMRTRDGADEETSAEEERRLMYVALTRARDRIYLTHARTRRTWGEVRACDPSRFLDEIPFEIMRIAK